MDKLLQFLKWAGVIVSPVVIIGNLVLNAVGVWQLGQNNIWVWTAILLGVFFICLVSLVYTEHKRLNNLEHPRETKIDTKTLPLFPLNEPVIKLKSQLHEYISDTYIKGRTFYLVDLLAPGASPIISNRTIEDCEILGPAIISLLGGGILVDSRFDGDLKSIFVEIEGDRFIIGVIGLKDCVFRRCYLRGIGIIGTKEQIEKAKQGFINHEL